MTAVTREAEPEVEGIARTMNCPQCGGRISTQVSSGLLTCVYCGYQAELRDDRLDPQPVSDRLEQVMDFVLPTVSGHAWAEGRLNLSCESCGARSLLPAGQKSQQCAYCGSSQLVDSPAFRDLVDPQVIALMHVDESQANRLAHSWLRKGLLAPDDLIQSSRQMRLRPAYYSCWTFDGTIEARWSCEVKESRGNQEHWEAMSGAHVEFFNDVLVSGVKALKEGELAGLEPFNLIEVEAFKPEYLAGWTTMVYDRSLADASLVAREKVVRRLKPLLYNLVAIGREKRNLSLNGCNWSGMTFKHVLLPVWIGTYQYGKEKFTLLVNGQTGKVAGEKPRDTIKMVFGSLSMVALIVLGLIGLWLFLRMRQGIY